MYCTTSIVERKEVFLNMKSAMVDVDRMQCGETLRTYTFREIIINLSTSVSQAGFLGTLGLRRGMSGVPRDQSA